MNKTIIISFLSSLFVSLSLFSFHFPELSKLPEKSKIRSVCEKTPGNPWFLRNATESVCAVLNKEMYNSFEKAKQLERAISAKDMERLIMFSRAINFLDKIEVHKAINTLLPEASYMETVEEYTMITMLPYVVVERAARKAAENQ